MSIIKLEPTIKKPDLKVSYKGKTYTLPGHISVAMLERLMGASGGAEGEAFFRAFLDVVIPDDFKKVLAQEDLAQLVPIWMEHIQGPKEPSSKN